VPVIGATDDLALALELADRADVITTARFGAADLHVDTKADDSPVTDADRDVEEMIRARVATARPSHAVLGEEGGSSGEAEWRWVVDPIDGTKNFARGVPVWATLLSLQHHGEETCAVVSAPALGRRWWAERGRGAMCNGESTRVSAVSRLQDATLSFTDVRDFARFGWSDGFARLASACRVVRGFGDFWSHMLVAEGACDISAEPEVNLWDLAALQIIVTEAGGRFTSLEGETTPGGGSVVCTNGHLHDEVLAHLQNSHE
jgi:histidinol-phosphatase